MNKKLRKTSSIFVLILLIAQQFLSFPLEAIAEGLSKNETIDIEKIEWLDNQGTVISEVENKSKGQVAINWNKLESQDELSAILEFPEIMTVLDSENSQIVNEQGKVVGNYQFLSKKIVELKVHSLEAVSGQVLLPMFIESEVIGKQQVIFRVDGQKYPVDFNILSNKKANEEVEIDTREDEGVTDETARDASNRESTDESKLNTLEDEADADKERTEENIEEIAELNTLNETSSIPSLSMFELNDEKGLDAYFSGNELVFRTTLGLTEESGSLVNSYLDIRIPKIENYINEETIRGSDVDIAKGPAEVILNHPEYYIIRYELESLSAGTVASVPIGFNTQEGYVPRGFELPVTAHLLNEDMEEIIKDKKIVKFDTMDLTVSKYVGSNNNNGRTITGGMEDPNRPGYLSENLEDLIPIEFTYYTNGPRYSAGSGRRYYNRFEIIDYLPEGAVFFEEENPGWVYDDDTKQASYVIEKENEGVLLNNTFHHRIALPKLKLYFPGAKIDPSPLYTNKVQINAYPYKKGDDEPIQVMTDDITFLLSETKPAEYRADKLSFSSQSIDIERLKMAHEYSWRLMVTNDSHQPQYDTADLENIVIDDYQLDDNLYFNRLYITPLNSDAFLGTIRLEVTFEDGTTETIADNLSINRMQQFDFSKYDKIVTGFKVSTTEGSTLKPGKTLTINAFSKFKDPRNVTTPTPTSSLPMQNYARYSANYAKGDTLTRKNMATVYLNPYNPRMSIDKLVTSGTRTYFLNEEIDYGIRITHDRMAKDQEIKDPVIVDILPTGFEYVPGSTSGRWPALYLDSPTSSIFPEPEIVSNYKNTGQTALIWYLPDTVVRNDNQKDSYFLSVLKYKVKITDLADIGANTNQAYFGWSNSHEVGIRGIPTQDIYDTNNNGETDDNVAGNSATVQYAPPETLIIKKGVKGNLNNRYLLPPAKALGEIRTDASYEIHVLNNSPIDVTRLTLLDLLPQVGDRTAGTVLDEGQQARGSEFPVSLAGPVEVPQGYTVYYTTDEQIKDSASYTRNANWLEAMTDYSQVRGIKIVLNDGERLLKGDSFTLTIPVTLPKDTTLENGSLTVNSIGQSLNPQYVYTESNNATLELVKYKVKGNVFNDENRDGVFAKDERTFENHIVTLVDEAGNLVNDFNGDPIQTTTDSSGYYEMPVYREGSYRIKVETPQGYTITEANTSNHAEANSHIIDDENEWTDSFTLNPDNREATKNAGYVIERTDITARKVWNDNQSSRPKIWFDLYRQVGENGRPEKVPNTSTLEVSTPDNEDTTQVTWTEIDAYAPDGTPYVFSVLEVDIEGNPFTPSGYRKNENGLEVINTALTEIPVKKVWDDANNQDGKRPESVTIKLFADGKETNQEVILNAGNNWRNTFANLDMYADEERIDYTIEEVNIPTGYTNTISQESSSGFLITNRYTPEVTEVSGEKIWEDADNQDGVKPEEITVNLLADGQEVAEQRVTAEDNWTYQFKELPKFEAGEEITYTVTEDTVKGYTTTVEGHNITNRYTPEERSITVTKAWEDANNQDGKRPESVEVELLANGERYGDLVLLNTANNWTYTWTELAVNAPVGEAISYEVREVNVPKTYDVTINAEDLGNVLITNHYTPEVTEVSGEKIWDDADNQDGKRPDAITIRLLAGSEEVAQVQVTAETDWSFEFNDLPKFSDGEEINYAIQEDPVENYSTVIDGMNVINSYTPGQTSINVIKVWEDDQNKNDARPDSITVKLIANGEETGRELTLTSENNWQDNFKNLDIYKAGELIEYTIEEVEVEGYKATITGSYEKGFVIKNQFISGTTDEYEEGLDNTKEKSEVSETSDHSSQSMESSDLPKTGEATQQHLYTLLGFLLIILGGSSNYVY